jgi:plastocyanin
VLAALGLLAGAWAATTWEGPALAAPGAQTARVAAPGPAAVSMTFPQFAPKVLTVTVGTTVLWTNIDSNINHTTTSDTGDADAWDSGTMVPGATFTHTFDVAGTFLYHCTFHASFGMVGTIVVLAAPPATTTPTPIATATDTPIPATPSETPTSTPVPPAPTNTPTQTATPSSTAVPPTATGTPPGTATATALPGATYSCPGLEPTRKLGDINGDGHVDLTDFSIFAGDFGKDTGQGAVLNSPYSDMNCDGKVDLTDFSIFAGQFGQ